jgi:hypothetical protein
VAHTPLLQGWPAQERPHAPQWLGSLIRLTSQPLPAFPSQLAKPALHWTPQLVPSQVAVPLAGTGQGVQLAPQVAVLLLAAQVFPHKWKPVLHSTPQLVPLQVAAPFVGTGQGVQLAPQVAVLLLDTQAAPQAWKPEAQVKPH